VGVGRLTAPTPVLDIVGFLDARLGRVSRDDIDTVHVAELLVGSTAAFTRSSHGAESTGPVSSIGLGTIRASHPPRIGVSSHLSAGS